MQARAWPMRARHKVGACHVIISPSVSSWESEAVANALDAAFSCKSFAKMFCIHCFLSEQGDCNSVFTRSTSLESTEPKPVVGKCMTRHEAFLLTRSRPADDWVIFRYVGKRLSVSRSRMWVTPPRAATALILHVKPDQIDVVARREFVCLTPPWSQLMPVQWIGMLAKSLS